MAASGLLAAARHGDGARFLASIGPTGVGAGLQLLVFALAARALGPDGFGQLAAIYAVTVLATEVAGLGGDAAMVREVAADPSRFPAAWRQALALLGLTLPIVGIAATAAAVWIGGAAVPLTIAAALVFGEIVGGRVTAAVELAFVAHGEPVRASLVRPAVTATRAATALLLFGLLEQRSLEAWAAATAAQSVLVALALLALVRRRYGAAMLHHDAPALRLGILMSLNQLARSLSGSLDRLVLATLLPPAAFGLYAAGARLLLLGALVIQSATRIVYPRFFAAATEGPDALARLTRRTAAQMALVGGLGLALVVVAAQTLPLLLGAAFADAARIGVLLAASVPCLALQYPAADALTASGRQGLRTALYLCGAAGSVGLVAAGARWAGPEGAAAGAVLGQATLAALLWGALGLSRWRPT